MRQYEDGKRALAGMRDIERLNVKANALTYHERKEIYQGPSHQLASRFVSTFCRKGLSAYRGI
jgi:hypothetical protein